MITDRWNPKIIPNIKQITTGKIEMPCIWNRAVNKYSKRI